MMIVTNNGLARVRFSLIAMMLLVGALFMGAFTATAYAKEEAVPAVEQELAPQGTVPAWFTAESIKTAGVFDQNFATAIYDSIYSAIMSDEFNAGSFTQTSELLAAFDGTINAREKGITSISGIKLLSNVDTIDLRDNKIWDLAPIEVTNSGNNGASWQDASIDELNNSGLPFLWYSNAPTINLKGNPLRNVPRWILGTSNVNGVNYAISDQVGFAPLSLGFVCDGAAKSFTLPLDMAIWGLEGGVFSATNSIMNAGTTGATLTSFDGETRYTQSVVSDITKNGDITINPASELSPDNTVNWRGPTNSGKKNINWLYPFSVQWYSPISYTVEAVSYGKVIMTKYNEDNTKALAGAVYEMYMKDDAGVQIAEGLETADEGDYVRYPDASHTYTTGSDGTFTVTGLSAGDYRFVEVKAPAGYEVNETPIDFSITLPDAADPTITLTGGLEKVAVTENAATVTVNWPENELSLPTVEKTPTDLGVNLLVENGGTGIETFTATMDGATLDTAASQIDVTIAGEALGTFSTLDAAKNAINAAISGDQLGENDSEIYISMELVFNSNEGGVVTVSQSNTPKATFVKTGDMNSLFFWGALLIVAGGVVLLVSRSRRSGIRS